MEGKTEDDKKGQSAIKDSNATAIVHPTKNEPESSVDNAKQDENKREEAVLDENGKLLSKNQLKKRRRYEKMMDQKKRRKLQDKEIRHAKALAEGRDLEKERQLLDERTLKGDGHQRRLEFSREKFKKADASFGICVDCSFEAEMSKMEVQCLALQLRYCYASNKQATLPVRLSIASLSGETRSVLDKVCGFPQQWEARAFSHSENSVEEMHSERKDKLIYLTSDSENTLQKLENDKIYVIGGIVDRNRLKRAAIGRAESLGITTAKLPISEHLELVTTKVLACNHVFEILLKVKENGNDWKQAMLDVLPHRKDAKSKSDDDDVAK
jgi:tRNA (guanine9-N1)-methyltransferase